MLCLGKQYIVCLGLFADTTYVLHSNCLIHFNDSQVELVNIEEIESPYNQVNLVVW